jgi:hypothetical protein
VLRELPPLLRDEELREPEPEREELLRVELLRDVPEPLREPEPLRDDELRELPPVLRDEPEPLREEPLRDEPDPLRERDVLLDERELRPLPRDELREVDELLRRAERRVVLRRSDAGISSCATALVSCGMSLPR